MSEAMLGLSIGELQELIGGRLRLGSLPPLAGKFECVRRVVLDSRDAAAGDVYWALRGARFRGEFLVEDAFARGALGAVTSRPKVEPWAGKFVLEVEDANRTLCRLAKCLWKSNFARQWLQVDEFDLATLQRKLAREDLSLLEDLTEHLLRRGCRAAA